MSQLKSINIPQPCHQSWGQMTPADNGRHCEQCSRIVTDFTGMSNDQIIAYLSNNAKVCGRFEPHQLNIINHQLNADKMLPTGRFKNWIIALSLLGSSAFLKASAQTKAPVVQTAVDTQKMIHESFPLGKIAISRDTTRYRVITGHIIDQADNTVIPGVTVAVRGTNQLTQTNANGEFRLRLPLANSQIAVSFIGFTLQIVNINEKNEYEIKLCESASVLGDVVIVKRPSFFKRVYYRFIKRPIKRLFS